MRRILCTLSLQERAGDRRWRVKATRSVALRIESADALTADQLDRLRALVVATLSGPTPLGPLICTQRVVAGVVSEGETVVDTPPSA